MKATSTPSAATRIIPARQSRIPKTVKKLEDGSMEVEWKDGTKGTLGAEDDLMQAFLIFAILDN